MPPTYIPQMVNLEVNDIRVIQEFAEQEGLGQGGFSVALRWIIRDWEKYKRDADYDGSQNQEGNSHSV